MQFFNTLSPETYLQQLKRKTCAHGAAEQESRQRVTWILTPRFANKYVYWDLETDFENGEKGRVLCNNQSWSYGGRKPGTLALRYDEPLRWLLAEDKKQLRAEWKYTGDGLTDKVLTPQDLGADDLKYWLDRNDSHKRWDVVNVIVNPIYVCPSSGMPWLMWNDYPEPNGTMFVLRRQPCVAEGPPVMKCAEDWSWQESNMMRLWSPDLSKRSFVTTDLVQWRFRNRWREFICRDYFSNETPQQFHDPRKFITETKADALQAIKDAARRRLRSITSRRVIKPRETLFFRMILGARELRKMVSLAA